MVGKDWVRLMARYNRWMNGKLYALAADLSDADRKLDRGAFFGSLHRTLDHLVWADDLWLGRFTGTVPCMPPVGTTLHEDFADLSAARQGLDQRIQDWAEGLDETWLDGSVSWFSRINDRHLSRPAGLAVAHFFNHQTHHRGQAATLLSQLGLDPGVTDLHMLPGVEDLFPAPGA